MRLVVIVAASLSAVPHARRPAAGPVYTQIYALKPREGVFAYARISPDGRRLVYASQFPAHPGSSPGWTETLVDLTTKKVLFNETGIDAYWSADGQRIIYSGENGVTVKYV